MLVCVCVSLGEHTPVCACLLSVYTALFPNKSGSFAKRLKVKDSFITVSGKGRWRNMIQKDWWEPTHADNEPAVSDDLDMYLFTRKQQHAVI